MTLVIALNVLLVVFALGTIVGLHAWAIASSRVQEQTAADARHVVRSRRRRRHETPARRLGNTLALR